MLTYLLTFVIVSLAMLGLAASVLAGRPQLQGRCGKRCECGPGERRRCSMKSAAHPEQRP